MREQEVIIKIFSDKKADEILKELKEINEHLWGIHEKLNEIQRSLIK